MFLVRLFCDELRLADPSFEEREKKLKLLRRLEVDVEGANDLVSPSAGVSDCGMEGMGMFARTAGATRDGGVGVNGWASVAGREGVRGRDRAVTDTADPTEKVRW